MLWRLGRWVSGRREAEAEAEASEAECWPSDSDKGAQAQTQRVQRRVSDDSRYPGDEKKKETLMDSGR